MIFTLTWYDYVTIWGFNLLPVLICYLALFFLAMLLAKITRKSLKGEWPKHLIAIPFSTLWSVFVFIYFLSREGSEAEILYRAASGATVAPEMAGALLGYMLIVGSLSVIFAVFMLAGAKKGLSK